MPKKSEEGAPAYMAQYASLMTILLAFFICLQTVGAHRVSRYKKFDFGYIRDAFSYGGGMGLLSFIKSLMPRYPHVVPSRENPNARLLGYQKGAFEADVVDANLFLRWTLRDLDYDLRIPIPARFEADATRPDTETRRHLASIGRVLYTFSTVRITVCCRVSTGNPDRDEALAARRALTMARFLKEAAAIDPDRLDAVGFAHAEYWEPNGTPPTESATELRLKRRRISPPATRQEDEDHGRRSPS